MSLISFFFFLSIELLLFDCVPSYSYLGYMCTYCALCSISIGCYLFVEGLDSCYHGYFSTVFFFLVLIFNDSDSTTVIHCVCKSTCANWFGLDLDYEFWFCILGFEL